MGECQCLLSKCWKNYVDVLMPRWLSSCLRHYYGIAFNSHKFLTRQTFNSNAYASPIQIICICVTDTCIILTYAYDEIDLHMCLENQILMHTSMKGRVSKYNVYTSYWTYGKILWLSYLSRDNNALLYDNVIDKCQFDDE